MLPEPLDKHIPDLAPHEGSWVAVRRSDGQAVAEFFKGSKCLHHIDFEKYALVTIGEYLASLNSPQP